ncbi:MAG: cytochrome bc complex cytochrome b subunit, partial [Geobacter sp.]
MLTRLGNWFNERWPFSELIRIGLDEEIPGGSSYAYVFGSLLLFTFSLQAVTGVWQLFYYVPSVQHAYDSLNYLRTEITFGWLIHGLHYWGANAMIILLLCHAVQVFTWGAYKRPRELTWLAGLGLFLVTLAMSFTGSPLPWDEQGYWATVVGTSIAGTVPFVGNLIKLLMRGGQEMGQLALSRMFVLHVAIFPVGLLA